MDNAREVKVIGNMVYATWENYSRFYIMPDNSSITINPKGEFWWNTESPELDSTVSSDWYFLHHDERHS